MKVFIINIILAVFWFILGAQGPNFANLVILGILLIVALIISPFLLKDNNVKEAELETKKNER